VEQAHARTPVRDPGAGPLTFLPRYTVTSPVKLAFHDADTDILADILARIVASMSACRSACHRNFRKSRLSDVSARILARMSVSVSASWNSSLSKITTLFSLLSYSIHTAGHVLLCIFNEFGTVVREGRFFSAILAFISTFYFLISLFMVYCRAAD